MALITQKTCTNDNNEFFVRPASLGLSKCFGCEKVDANRACVFLEFLFKVFTLFRATQHFFHSTETKRFWLMSLSQLSQGKVRKTCSKQKKSNLLGVVRRSTVPHFKNSPRTRLWEGFLLFQKVIASNNRGTEEECSQDCCWTLFC